MESIAYFVDRRGYLLRKVGHDFYKLKFRHGSEKVIWELDNYELENIVDYSVEALKSRNRHYDDDYVAFVLNYMKTQFYEEVLG